jgi:hypothetical protein
MSRATRAARGSFLPPQPTRETELGTEQQCSTCHDWWPLASDFWHREGTSFKARCKDCNNAYYRSRAQQLIGRQPAPPTPVPEVFSAVQWGSGA